MRENAVISHFWTLLTGTLTTKLYIYYGVNGLYRKFGTRHQKLVGKIAGVFASFCLAFSGAKLLIFTSLSL